MIAAAAVVYRLRRGIIPLGAMALAYSSYHGAASGSSQHTLSALARWSCQNKRLPAVDSIKVLHVYDFDNTLFKTPTPNPAIWSGPTIGRLMSQEIFQGGGWWQKSHVLASTGQGIEVEESRAWEGWWNDNVVQLVQLSMRQPDSLCVLLTGRSEKEFSLLIKRIVESKGLIFDIISLKPHVSPASQKLQSTMHFKQLFLTALMETYKGASEIKLYEDRVRHVRVFQDFLDQYNTRRHHTNSSRSRLAVSVFHVTDSVVNLDPVSEVATVQHLINNHNAALSKPTDPQHQHRLKLKKHVFQTGYMINPNDVNRMIDLAQIPESVPYHELKYHANNILICPHSCPENIRKKIGGPGSKMLWEVMGTSCLEGALWAVCVRPVPATAAHHTDHPVPVVVVATRRAMKTSEVGRIRYWEPIPLEKKFVFETTIGESVNLNIELEDSDEEVTTGLFAKHRHLQANDHRARGSNVTFSTYSARYDARSFRTSTRGAGRVRELSFGRASRIRGGGRGGRGRGGYQSYRSLDEGNHIPVSDLQNFY